MPVKVYDGTNWVTVAGDGQAGAPGAAGTSSSITTWVKTASGGETSVSGTGDTGYGTLAYTVGQELVYLNGVLLDRGDDYTATNGTSITGLTALLANDVVTVWTVNSFSVANTYTIAQADAAFAPISVTSGMTLLSTTSLSGASTTISSISGAYKNLVIFVRDMFPSTNTELLMGINSDNTASNYVQTIIRGTATTGSPFTDNTTPGVFLAGHTVLNSSGDYFAAVTIPDYANTTTKKSVNAYATYTTTWSGGTVLIYGVN